MDDKEGFPTALLSEIPKDPTSCKDETLNPEYNYLTQSYSTENFKMEIRELPPMTTHSILSKFLRIKKVDFSKAKIIKGRQSCHAYVTLKSAIDRDNAIQILHNEKLKGRNLLVRKSLPNPDPLVKIQQTANKNSKVYLDDSFDTLPEKERFDRINTQVVPLWNLDYEKQLLEKSRLLSSVMKKCGNNYSKLFSNKSDMNSEIFTWFKNVNLDFVIRSPSIIGYRNKCEFNIGPDRTLGFRLGQYKEGTVKVVTPPPNCPIISDQMRKILEHFQKYLNEQTKLDGFNPVNHEGYWRQILVRTNRNHKCMVSFSIHRQQLTDEELEQEFQQIKLWFADSVCSLYAHVIDDRSSQISRYPPKHIDGEEYLYEKLLKEELLFRISPLSFFQVNTDAAEKLYSIICEFANCNDQTVVLDICCGTGTIGICLARSVKKVIGIELNEDAINDAKFNAQNNQLTNMEFFCGRAETLIPQVLKLLNSDIKDVVAILDPPRCGLSSSLIKSIRNNWKISRVVYVSCDAKSAQQNFIDLCRPKSNAYRGNCFIPKMAAPIDMFPHTEGCELVILFERSS